MMVRRFRQSATRRMSELREHFLVVIEESGIHPALGPKQRLILQLRNRQDSVPGEQMPCGNDCYQGFPVKRFDY